MINNVNQDNDLITAQKNDLTSKMAKIDYIMANIKLLKDYYLNDIDLLSWMTDNKYQKIKFHDRYEYCI